MKREVKEETGYDISVIGLISVYSKYYDTYPNGDKSQPVLLLFRCEIVGGEGGVHDNETIELAWFSKDNKPPIFNSQHEDMFNDVFNCDNGTVIR